MDTSSLELLGQLLPNNMMNKTVLPFYTLLDRFTTAMQDFKAVVLTNDSIINDGNDSDPSVSSTHESKPDEHKCLSCQPGSSDCYN